MSAAPPPRWLPAAEFVLVLALGCAAAASLNLQGGFFGWSWDALNHHVYLGYVAEQHRWHLDVAPAASQTYHHPYLYWPIYRLSLLRGDGAVIGALWSVAQAALVVPPLWCLARRLLPDAGPGWSGWLEGLAWRSGAIALAGGSALVLTLLQVTGNDLLSAVPLLWALVLASDPRDGMARAGAAAALWGAAVALKLSNVVFVPLLLALWWTPGQGPAGTRWGRLPLGRGLAVGASAVAGFGLVYAPWGWALWEQTGNPFYPMLGHWFGPR